MYRNRKSLMLTLVAALCLSIPFAHADGSNAQVTLNVESVCGRGSNIFNIRNAGTTTSSTMRYRLIARASEFMPPLHTWQLVLMPLAPGQVFRLYAPRDAHGLKLSIEVETVPGTVVNQQQRAVSYPNFCW